MLDSSQARKNVDGLKQRREQHSHAVGSPSFLLANAIKARCFSPVKQFKLHRKLDHDKLSVIGDRSRTSRFTGHTESTSPSSSSTHESAGSPRSLGNKRASLLQIITGHKESRSCDAQKLANALKERRYSPVKQVENSHKLYHDKLKATSELSIGNQSPTSTFTELTESTTPPSSTLESQIRIILDEEDESKQAVVLDLEEFLIWKPSAVVKEFESLSVSINTAETDGSSLYLEDKDSGRQHVKGRRERPRVQRKASTQSNKGRRERPRAQRTPSVKSKKVVTKRNVEGHLQSDRIQRDVRGNGETVCISYSRSSEEDTPDEVDAHSDGAARLREMYGDGVDKLRQQDMLDLQYRSTRRARECMNRQFMQDQMKPEHKIECADLEFKDRCRDVLDGMRAEIAAMKNRRSSRRASRVSVIDDRESEAPSSAQDYSAGSKVSGGLTVSQSTAGGADTNLLQQQTLSEDESVDTVEFRFVSQMGPSLYFDDEEHGPVTL